MKAFFNNYSNNLILLVLLASFICVVLSQEPSNGNDAIINKTQQQQRSSFDVASQGHPKQFDFSRFKKLFKKSYGSLIEELRRQKLFFARAIRAFLSFIGYKKGKRTSFLRVNEMSDSTEEERQSMINHRLSQETNIIKNRRKRDESSVMKPSITKTNLPDEMFVDHRRTNCFNPIKTQGYCGSCYAFSTTALFEWEFCRETGQLLEFSEQYPLDCGQRVGLDGCYGGKMENVADFYREFGLEISANFPYRASSDNCPYDFTAPIKTMGYLRTTDDSRLYGVAHSYVEQYLQRKPVLMGYTHSTEFYDYGGGIDIGEHCEYGAHGMLIVGSGRENGIEYWLARNSYGTSWGDEGYHKLAKEATHCLLNEGMGTILISDHIFQGLNSNYNGEPIRNYIPV